MRTDLAARYARWIDRQRYAILGCAAVLTAAAGLYAQGLPVHGDFAYLLPSSAPSVVQLHELEKRVANLGTLLVIIDGRGDGGDDPVARAAAARDMHERLEAIDKSLVATVVFDDSAARQFIWDHRFLYADKRDLLEARDALADELGKAKLRQNPLYVDFDDKQAGGDGAAADRGKALQAKLDDAEVKKNAVGRVSKDGRLQLIVVRTSFEPGTASKGRELVKQAEKAAAEVERKHGVSVGLAGDVILTMAEHDALLSGMLKAVLLTIFIVALGLTLFYRSVRAIGALFASLAVGVAITFAFTRLAIGHLNMASAFLSSIVVGNGINFGILFVARHFEERRRGLRGVEAIGRAIQGTFTGTLAAALTAAVAYGSLAATTFRGFKHFGIIGGVGMVLCWVTAYTVLPAALAIIERRGLVVRRTPGVGALLAKIIPRTHGGVAAVAAAAMLVTAGAGVATWRYLEHPYEDDFRNLRSSTDRIEEVKVWQDLCNQGFGGHISGGFVVAATDREAVREIAAKLKAVSDDAKVAEPLVSVVRSIDDVLPKDQPEKLAILDDLRRMIDHESGNLGDAERARLARLRPPSGLTPITEADLPEDMALPFTELDGRRGLLVFADRAARINTWIAGDLLDYTAGVAAIDLPPGTVFGGANFVFADVIRSMEGDGPRATVIALIGAVVVIMALLGFGRHAAVTLVCMSSGVLLMLAGAWVLGLRVNFLDFVALPITIGIGIDYAVNIVARARQGSSGQEGRVGAARAAIATTGGAVALCSFTTIVGYGSLLLSANHGIHSFGTAAILGELTCIASALLLAPTLLQLLAPRRGGAPRSMPSSPPQADDPPIAPRENVG